MKGIEKTPKDNKFYMGKRQGDSILPRLVSGQGSSIVY